MRPLIGITGGIGSGKSTVAGLFQTLGIPMFDADASAKQIMTTNKDVKQALISLLGDKAYTAEGILDRSFVASMVFENKPLLEKMNRIVHPEVYKDLLLWMSHDHQKKAPYLMQESAILFEENLVDRFYKIILVVAPEDIRIERVVARDKTTPEQVKKRIANQWPDEKKLPMADFIIYNDGNRPLIRQVRDIDSMIKEMI